jgi:hypothetical protein
MPTQEEFVPAGVPVQSVTLPARAWALVLGAFVVIVALLGTMIVLLVSQREHVDSQDTKITALYEAAAPLLRESGPAVSDARRLAPQVRSTGRDIVSLVRAATPVVEAVNAADVTVLLTSLGSAARAGTEVLGRLAGVDLAAAVRSAHALADVALHRGRLAALLDESTALLRELDRLQLPRVARRSLDLLPAVLRIQHRLLAIQRQTLALQGRQFGLLSQSLGVQREALVHVRSLDNKTGGPVAGG